ncbi:MAG: glycosyltransferase family 39 protein [Chloroflexi bacterium]|nr:glycosyltransferase family 39 protein [Chloroflexota bacterium]
MEVGVNDPKRRSPELVRGVGESYSPGRGEIVLSVAILLVAAFFRLYRLEAAPPGLQHDEVFHGHDASVVLQGNHLIYFESNAGNEPLFVYLVAGTIALFGTNYLGIRLAAVLCGLATIIFTYLLARKAFGYRVALLTSAGLAVSFWPVFVSRVGLRAASLPPLAAATAYFFWAGLCKKQDAGCKRKWEWICFGLAGVFLGGTLYTYPASRMIPVVFVVFMVYLALFNRLLLLERWKGILLFFALAALVAVPIGVAIWTHPRADVRVQQLSQPLAMLAQGDPRLVIRFTLDTLKMFTLRGDPVWRYNLAGRPVFEPLGGALFYLGLALVLLRWRRPRYAFLLLWLPLALVPSMITDCAPSFLRASGALPVVYVFPALAVEAAWRWLVERFSKKAVYGLAAALLLLLAGNAWWTYRDYFTVWAQHPEVRFVYQTDLTEAAHYLDDSDIAGPVCISSSSPHDLDPFIFDFTLKKQRKVKWYDGPYGLVFPDGGQRALYIFPASTPLHPGLQEEFFQRARLVEERRFPDGELAFTAYELEAREVLQAKIEVLRSSSLAVWSPEVQFLPGDPHGLRHPVAFPVDFNHRLELLGYELADDTLSAGEWVHLTSYWRVLQDVASPLPLAIFVHLLDSQSTVWAGRDILRDILSVATAGWEAGDIFAQVHHFPLPPAIPAGQYQVEIGVYSRADMQRFAVFEEGQPVADRLLLEPVSITGR